MIRPLKRLYLRICIWAFDSRAEATKLDIEHHAVNAEALARRVAKLTATRDMLRGQLMRAS